jgi:aspartyl protease family protein
VNEHDRYSVVDTDPNSIASFADLLLHFRDTLNMADIRIGKGMVFAAWVLFLLLAAWMFQGLLERQFNPNPEPNAGVAVSGRSEVTLQRNRSGHYVATGEMNGERVNFLLDTGATDVALSTRLASQLALPRGAPVSLSTANGVVQGYRTTIDTVSVGNIRLNNVRGVVSPGIDDAIVLLGMSFLQHLELVQRDGTLLLRQ